MRRGKYFARPVENRLRHVRGELARVRVARGGNHVGYGGGLLSADAFIGYRDVRRVGRLRTARGQ